MGEVDTSVLTISLGVGLGMMTTLMEHSRDIMDCFESCDSWVLKVEKVLTYFSFMMGSAKPGQVVFKVVKQLLNSICIQYFQITFDEHPTMERTIEIGLSYFGQRKLAEVWDLVRDSSLCMRMNDCDHEYFAELNNFKIYWCDVDPGEDDWYSGRKLSTCEQIFNDSPLILLSIFVVGMFCVANKINYEQERSPTPSADGLPQIGSSPSPKPSVTPASGGPQSPQTTSLIGPNSSQTPGSKEPEPSKTSGLSGPHSFQTPESSTPQPSQTPVSSRANPSETPGSSEPQATQTPDSIPSTQMPPTLPSTKPPSTSGSRDCESHDFSSTQPLDTICPSCINKARILLPHPMPVYCSTSCTCLKDNDPNPRRSDNNVAIRKVVNKEMDRFMENVKQILCSKCQKKVEGIKPNAKKARLSVCLYCGKEHP